MKFDIRDLFRCVRLGWSGKKIWVGLIGLLFAWVGYSVLVVIAHFQSGNSASILWHRYGLFPGATLGEFDLLGTGLHILGMVWALAVVLVTTSMMCKIAFQQLRGDDFYSSGDAWQFAKENWKAVLFGPVALLALFAFFVICGIVIGLVAKWIPVAGELAFALSFVPVFFAALLAVFIGLVFCVSLVMSPAIVGTVQSDALEVVIQSFSLTWSQPWRLILYTVWMEFAVWVGFMLLGIFTLSAIALIAWASGLFMDVKLATLFDLASRYLVFRPERWDRVLASLPAPATPSGSEIWGGRILGVMLIVITGIVISYAQAAYASGLSLMYVILRHKKDDENLLEWELDEAIETEGAAEGSDEITGKEAENDTADSETA
ncbi:MAG: hypothetical protein QGG64_00755 [Candidatus Latescibacteria bacterium]|jgi:hypothetical protein|nr:hypothetical protein [Candidatus Latescibacterota bacterium]